MNIVVLASGTTALTVRALRQSLRQPWTEIGNLLIPVFFFLISIGGLSTVARQAFHVEDYGGFSLPVAVLQCVAGVASISGIAVVTDIEKGYFDKLLITPMPRLALVLSRMFVDAIRSGFFVFLILIFGLLMGADIQSGFRGFIAILALGMLFGLAYSGIGIGVALLTGNAQTAQVGFLLFFPLMFLAPTFVPRELFEPWMQALASLNPVTYMIEGLRELVLMGWNTESLLKAFSAITGFAIFTTSFSIWALQARLK